MRTEAQSQDPDREATTGRFPLGLIVACEVLCTGAACRVGNSLDVGPAMLLRSP